MSEKPPKLNKATIGGYSDHSQVSNRGRHRGKKKPITLDNQSKKQNDGVLISEPIVAMPWGGEIPKPSDQISASDATSTSRQAIHHQEQGVNGYCTSKGGRCMKGGNCTSVHEPSQVNVNLAVAEPGPSETHAALLRLLDSERERRTNEQDTRDAKAKATRDEQNARIKRDQRQRNLREAESTRAQEQAQREQDERQTELLQRIARAKENREHEEKLHQMQKAQREQDERQIELLQLVAKAKEKRENEEKERQAQKARREQDQRQIELLKLVAMAKEKRENEERERQAQEAEAARVQQEILAAQMVRVAREMEAAQTRKAFLAAERERLEKELLAREAEAARVLQEFLAAERERQEKERLAREAEAARIRQEHLAAERERKERARLAKEAARQAKEEAARKLREAELEVRRLEVAKQEAAFTTKHIVLGSTLITCGAGIDIRHVVSGFESCQLTVKNLPPNAKLTEIADLLTQQGIDANQFLILGTRGVDGGKRLEAKILANAEQGEAIAIGLDGIDFRDETLSFEVTENSSADAMGETSAHNPEVLTVSWRAPSVSIVATYESMDAALSKAKALDRTIWKGRRIRVEMNRPPTGPALKYYSPMSIKITGLHTDATPTNILDLTGPAATKTIKSCLYNLPAACQALEQHMRTISNGRMISFEVTSQPNGGVDGNVTTHIRFESWEQAKAARDSLDGKRLHPDYPQFRFSLPNPLQFVSTIPIQQYRAQKRQWDSLVETKNSEGSHLRINIHENERVALRVLGNDKKAVGSLKVRVETLVSGERLDVTYWHRSFSSPKGRHFLAKVSSDTGVYIRSDWKVHSLMIYGDGAAKDEARQLILREVDRLALLEWTVLLKRQSVGYFVRKGLTTLKEILGEDSVSLDLSSTPCKLTIRGGEEARHYLSMVLDQSLEDSDTCNPSQDTTDVCPICYDMVSHPVQLGCGHIYCTACIRHYLISASDTKVFPLACMGDEAQCHVVIPIPVIQRFLPQQRFDHLVKAAFLAYIDLHPNNFRYCTTPDCVQIYRCNSGVVQKCPSCFATVCPSCHEEAHEGMTCAERALHKDPTEQERLTENWAMENGAKKCPSCKVWIEKTYGCDHMTCNCGAHICWKCMGIFPADEIYDHLGQVHNGVFEDEAVDEGAFARQREFEENQRRREAEAEAAEERRQYYADVERLNERRRNDLLLQQQAAATQARQIEDYRRAQAAYDQEVRAEQQRQADRAAAERQRLYMPQENRRREEIQRQADRAAAERQRLYTQQQEAWRREEYQKQLDRRQEEIQQVVERNRKDSSWCIVM